MDIDYDLAKELKEANQQLGSIRVVHRHHTMCYVCRNSKLTLFTLQDMQRTPEGFRDLKTFQMVEGFCTGCHAVDLWKQLSRYDATRDASLWDLDTLPELHRDCVCRACGRDAFRGIWRKGVCTFGECLACHAIIVPPSLADLAVVVRDSTLYMKKLIQSRKTALEAMLQTKEIEARQKADKPEPV